MGAVTPLATPAQLFIVTSTAASGLPALRSTASAHGARLINGGTMGVASTPTVTTSFAAPTITPGLATATATPTVPATAIAAAGGEHVVPVPLTSKREQLVTAPRTSDRAHHTGRAEHRRDGSKFYWLADRVRHLQDKHRNQTTNSQKARQDRDHGAASARQHRPLGSRDASGARELPLHDQVFRPLHQV